MHMSRHCTRINNRVDTTSVKWHSTTKYFPQWICVCITYREMFQTLANVFYLNIVTYRYGYYRPQPKRVRTMWNAVPFCVLWYFHTFGNMEHYQVIVMSRYIYDLIFKSIFFWNNVFTMVRVPERFERVSQAGGWVCGGWKTRYFTSWYWMVVWNMTVGRYWCVSLIAR